MSGSYAFVADGEAGLQVLDITNPANPVWMSRVDIPSYANGVAVSDKYALVAAGYAGLHLVDISNPQNPTQIVGYQTPGTANDVVVSGQYALLALGDAGLQVIDISNPTNPVTVGNYQTPGYASSVAISDNYALVALEWAGLGVIDMSNPANPVMIGGYDTEGYATDIVVSANRAFLVSEWPRSWPYGTMINYVTIFDVSDPANPVRIGLYGDWYPMNGISVAGTYLYIVSRCFGFHVTDASNPAIPRRVGWCDIPLCESCYPSPSPTKALVVGDRAYIPVGTNGVQILDISNPKNPVRVGGYDTPGKAGGIAVSGSYVYVADGQWGLQILRVGGKLPPAWSDPRMTTNGFEATLRESSPGNYRIEWSENLISWATLVTVTNAVESVRVVDPLALTFPRRFYRAVRQ